MTTVATKIMLGQRPASVPKTVTVTHADGSTVDLQCKYKYRTREELGEWEQAHRTQQASNVSALADNVDTFWRDLASQSNANGATMLLDCLVDWDAGIALDEATLKQLFNEQPGIGNKLLADYRAAINEGRLGN